MGLIKILLIFCLAIISTTTTKVDDKNGGKNIEINPTSLSASEKQVVCYTPTWGSRMLPRIDTKLCTIFVIAFAHVNRNEAITLPNISEFKALKTGHSKLLLGVTAQGAAASAFSRIAASPEKRSQFVEQCFNIVRNEGLDGVDIDWEFPGKRDRSSFVLLHQALKKRFQSSGYLVTTAVSVGYWLVKYVNVYDIPALAQAVDYINLMAYDMHMDAAWDKSSGVSFNAPLNARVGDSVTKGLNYYLKGGAPASKLNVGVPFYSRLYQLEDPLRTLPGSPFIPGHQARNTSYTQAYIRYCKYFNDPAWKKARDTTAQAPYMHRDGVWMSYEDTTSIDAKANLALQHNLAGVMVWSINQDDYLDGCGDGTWPLLKTINSKLNRRI